MSVECFLMLLSYSGIPRVGRNCGTFWRLIPHFYQRISEGELTCLPSKLHRVVLETQGTQLCAKRKTILRQGQILATYFLPGGI